MYIRIHKEGYKILAIVGFGLLLLNLAGWYYWPFYLKPVLGVSIVLFLFLLYFFRNPKLLADLLDTNNKQIIAPADGRIVVIEEVNEAEYFNDKRIQISIFMSPTNVHVNRSPISGKVTYTKYHPGKYLVAWHPKSSTLNERFTSVIANEEEDLEILVRQIAGKVARKIANYLDEGKEIIQREEFGFIKLGSRVDLFLPLDSAIKVDLNQKVKGGRTVLAELP
jgi:phosphatidylserine decarboxylase